jgi:Zn-dependent protease with chaperone function
MTFPLDLIIVIIAAELYAEAQPLGSGFLSMGGTYGWFYSWLVYLGLCFFATIVILRLAEAGFSSAGPAKGYRLYKMLRLLHRVIGVILYPLFLYMTGWSETISGQWGLPSWSVIDDALLLLPYLAWTMNWHLLSLRMGRILWHREWTLGEHMWFYFRQETLPVLVPWLVLRGAADGVAASSAMQGFEPVAEWGSIGVSVMFFLGLLYFFPVWLALTLGTSPLPQGPLRARIESLMSRAGVRFRDVLLWRTGGARVLNAAVVGLVPRTRYCIISDTLLETLPSDETEAVVAHELGHAMGHHLPVYLEFVFLFMGIAVTLFAAVPADLAANYLFSLPVLAVLTLIFWPGAFGIVSRTLEDEADLYSAELEGDPEPLIRALSRMAASSGSGRASGSWRHHSVDVRVGHLRTFSANPGAAALLHNRVKVLRWAAGIAAVIAIAISLNVSLPEVWTRDAGLERARAAAMKDFENADAWAMYGKVLFQRGKYLDAEQALLQALSADPGRIDVRERLRTLSASTTILPRMAGVFIKSGWYDDAHKIAEELKTAGNNKSYALVSARLKLAPGSKGVPNSYRDPAGAEPLLRELLGQGDAEVYSLLAASLLEQGRAEEARTILLAGEGKYPQDPAFRELREKLPPEKDQKKTSSEK